MLLLRSIVRCNVAIFTLVLDMIPIIKFLARLLKSQFKKIKFDKDYFIKARVYVLCMTVM